MLLANILLHITLPNRKLQLSNEVVDQATTLIFEKASLCVECQCNLSTPLILHSFPHYIIILLPCTFFLP